MKYKIVLFNSPEEHLVIHSNSWLYCKLKMKWFNFKNKVAIWLYS